MMMGVLMAAALAAGAAPAEVPLTAPGPNGPLGGTLREAGPRAPVVLIVPGSGPTDRDGNNPLGVKAAPYRLLAEALAAQGVASVRIDKRGMFGSKAAIPDANAVKIADYAADTRAWVAAIRAKTGARCVWVLGHSEGGLVALQTAQAPAGLCGVILVATAGRPLGAVMRDQLRANPANAPILAPALAAIDTLEAGGRVDPATLPTPLQGLFNPAVQPFLADLFAHDPATLAGAIRLPMLIVQGDHDLQVSVADAQALADAQPRARLAIMPGVNHVLKTVTSEDRAANLATYADPALPIAPSVPAAIARFVKR